MTVAEFFGCAFLTFGPALYVFYLLNFLKEDTCIPLFNFSAMFVFTIAHDPMRIIILLMASFFWLVAMLLSSIVWFAVIPLRNNLLFGIICSVFLQELFRYLIYLALRKTERGLRQVADDIQIVENKHTLAYVTGLGFGIISAAFAVLNVLADAGGPGTLGLNGGSEIFFITSAAQALCMILLNVFWTIIFFSGSQKYEHIIFVVVAHLFVSCMSLWNGSEWYGLTLPLNFLMTLICGIIAFKIAGGSSKTLQNFFKCQQ